MVSEPSFSVAACVVIPHLNNKAGLVRALRSVGGRTTFIVDGSGGGAPRVLTDATLIGAGVLDSGQDHDQSKNSFAISANAGLKAAEAAGFSTTLLLNDDAALEPGALRELERVFDSRDNVGAVGPLLYDKIGLESAGLCFSPRTARAVQRSDIPLCVEERVALSGACLLLSSAERFDESFEHGFEDYELCMRMAKLGKLVLIAPEARVFHEGGGTVSRRSRRAVSGGVSGHLRLVKDAPYKRALVIFYAGLQLMREGGGTDAFKGFYEGIKPR